MSLFHFGEAHLNFSHRVFGESRKAHPIHFLCCQKADAQLFEIFWLESLLLSNPALKKMIIVSSAIYQSLWALDTRVSKYFFRMLVKNTVTVNYFSFILSNCSDSTTILYPSFWNHYWKASTPSVLQLFCISCRDDVDVAVGDGQEQH